jgi:hypothetical protein
MYSAIYRKLLGGKFAKFIQVAVLMIAFVSLLFFVVFPLVDTYLPEDPSING